ncbi:hypothetical protein DBR42_03925 [Pelomonas sp. HMWF004]|nr:hypothetical protein DBR42_03925 [Pelomonas sp. HMWF004]
MNRKTWRLCAAFALSAMVMASPTRAEVINFEGANLANLYGAFEPLRFGTFNFYFQGDGGLIGTVDDLEPATAPTGNATQFGMGLNFSVFSFYQDNLTRFKLQSFDFAFVPYPDSPPLTEELVLVASGEGEAEPGVWGLGSSLGPNAFFHEGDADYMRRFESLSSLSFFVCAYDPVTHEVCANGVVPNVQFALDNIVLISSVPEPATWALAMLGMVAVGAARSKSRRGINRV